MGDVAQLPALLSLEAFGGGEHLFNSSVSRQEIDGGEEGKSVGRGHRKNHGGGCFLTSRFRVRVKEMR